MSRLRLNKLATPGTPAASKGELFYSSTLSPAALAFIDEAGNVTRVAGSGSVKDYRLINSPDTSRTILNGTTTFTPSTGASALYVECVGGGGAGGGAASGTSGTNHGTGGGGGGGGWASKWATTAVSGAHNSIAVGAGGTPGTAGGNAGGNGGDTTFTDNAAGAICVGKGGSGGASGVVQTTITIGYAGGAGGVAGTGDRSIPGQNGDYSLVLGITAANFCRSGFGGNAGMGYGAGAPAIIASAAGTAGSLYGGGGSGAVDFATTARQGGAGGNGIIRIWEYA